MGERFMDNFLQDAIDLERQRNTLQDNRLDAIERRLNTTFEWLQEQIYEYQKHSKHLERENVQLRRLTEEQADIICELQCRVDPYSSNGDSICNYLDDM